MISVVFGSMPCHLERSERSFSRISRLRLEMTPYKTLEQNIGHFGYLRHLFEQPAESFHCLPHVETFLNRPDTRRHGVYDWNL
jgi:hypothetical protein